MEFNLEQLAAVRSTEKNLLLLAGAGTGKTRTIIGRALHLIDSGTAPSRILIVTFTRRAANEIRSRLAVAGGEKTRDLTSGTFHYLCLRTMSARRKWFGFDNLTVMDREDQLQLMKLVRSEVVGRDGEIPPSATLVNYYSYARNTNQPTRDYIEKFTELEPLAVDLVLKIFDAYKERKRANSYFDYDDILHRFAKVLHDSDTIRAKVCSQYDHVLVDEMQDTNPLQWLILESFSKHCQLFCVGDDAQSIYAFRGADFRNVHSFRERLPDSKVLKLQQNYRSTQPILDVANWLLSESPLDFDKTLKAIQAGGEKPRLIEFDSEYDEADWIASAIKRGKAEGRSWVEHMILVRTAYSARPIEAKLIEQKIPYRFIGGVGLFQMAHVRDLLSAVRVAVNHRDEIAWMRYLTLWPRIGEVTAARLVQQLTAESTGELAYQSLAGLLPKRPEVYSPPQAVASKASNVVAALSAAIDALQPLMEVKYDRWESRSKDFELLRRLAGNHRTLQGFLETYALDPVSATEFSAEDVQDEGTVTLITVHSAKGTEAEVCFVAALQPGNYPHSRSLQDNDAIEEERRVLYVALTRAKHELNLTRSLSQGFGRASWNAAQGSRYFLESLPSPLVEHTSGFTSPSYHWQHDDDVIG